MSIERGNDYNEIAEQYKGSEAKPDKRFSILPTTLGMIGDVTGKTVLDLGCGDGFFTEELGAAGAQRVIGIDNSEKQIELAQRRHPRENVEYRLADIFKDTLPPADIINSPFVLNYAKDARSVHDYLMRLFYALNPGGRLALVIDLPSGKNLEKFGARKTLAEDTDGAPITIELFNNGTQICALHAFFFREETVCQLLQDIGFQNVTVHAPTVSSEGVEEKGSEFWDGYTENCELGYITADKS